MPIPLSFVCSKERGKEKSRQKQMLRCFCHANAHELNYSLKFHFDNVMES
jgi:hypothetical protein